MPIDTEQLEYVLHQVAGHLNASLPLCPTEQQYLDFPEQVRDIIEVADHDVYELQAKLTKCEIALRDAEARALELEKELQLIGDFAVVNFDDEVVGRVDEVLKHSTYKDASTHWLRTAAKCMAPVREQEVRDALVTFQNKLRDDETKHHHAFTIPAMEEALRQFLSNRYNKE